MNPTDSFSDEKLESYDGVKKVYRITADLVRRLDGLTKRAKTCEDLFVSEAKHLRIRLREQCERLMFVDPVGHGKKAEDLLWRKVYYDVITSGKQMLKNEESAFLMDHLRAGTGTYHHLLFRIKTEFHLKDGATDFLFATDNRLSKNVNIRDGRESKSISAKRKDWAVNAFHRCLVCLGDLARYRHELFPNFGTDVASRYYAQAAAFAPTLGMPHNQQGTLTGTTGYCCDAVYHYMRCLVSPQSFEGSKGNLERTFEKAHKMFDTCAPEPVCAEGADFTYREYTVKRCLARFLQFCEFCCICEDGSSSTQLEQLCQQILQDFYTCLQFPMPTVENETVEQDTASPQPRLLFIENQLLFRLIAMALMGTHLLMKRGSKTQSAAIAFSLALFSHLLNYTVRRFQIALGLITDVQQQHPAQHEFCVNLKSNVDCLSIEKVNLKSKPRLHHSRLRRLHQERNGNLEDSDLSEGEHSVGTPSDSDEQNAASDNSDVEKNGSDGSSSESDEASSVPELLSCDSYCNGQWTNGNASQEGVRLPYSRTGTDKYRKHKPAAGKIAQQQMQANKVCVLMEGIEQEELLPAIKMCTDWLSSHPNIFNACAQGSQVLWDRMATLLNIFIPVLSREDGIVHAELKEGLTACRQGKIWTQPWPLPEDVVMHGFPLLDHAHVELPFDESHRVWLSRLETCLLRVACLHQFGLVLVRSGVTNLVFDQAQVVFKKMDAGHLGTQSNQEHKNAVETQRLKIMENMAQLWLQAEVTELESSVQSGSEPRLSPYLVVTATVLTNRFHILRQLIASKRFIVVIPIVVIRHLDRIKKGSLQAREVIRWLEVEFRQGNRYLRAQKPHEQIRLSPIKYPRRKDKEAWDFFQVLECCKHLAQQKGHQDNGLVTLLTAEEKTIEPLVQTADVRAENVDLFLQKWQNSTTKER